MHKCLYIQKKAIMYIYRPTPASRSRRRWAEPY